MQIGNNRPENTIINKHIQHTQNLNPTTTGVQQIAKAKYLGMISERLRVSR